MSITKDGFFKQKDQLSNIYVLLAAGGHQRFGNALGDIPLSNQLLNAGLNADMLDGKHIDELFTAFSEGAISSSGNIMSQANHSITIGGVTLSAGSSSANIINSLSVSKLTSNMTTNLTVGITVNGIESIDKVLTDLYSRDSDKLDGKHLNELFEEFNDIGNQTTRIKIGGVTKDLKIDADMLDGKHIDELFTTFSGGAISSTNNTLTQTNHAITIGGVTLYAGSSTANIINSLSVSKLTSDSTTNLTVGITINGVASADKTITDLYARDADKLDGKHLNQLFTEFTDIGSQTTRITIGGVTKDLKIDADLLDGYHFSDLEDRYVNITGDWMDEDAQLSFKGPSGSTSIYARLGYMSTSLSGFTMHGGSQNKAFYIHSNGYAANSDTGGLAIDNDGVTIFGAGDDGKVFRVLNEDNVDDGPQFLVTKNTGAVIKYNLSVGQNTVNTSYKFTVNGTSYLMNDVWIGAHGSNASIGTGYADNDTTRYNYITFYGSNSNGDIQYNAGSWTSGDHIGHLFNIWDGSNFSVALSIRTISGNVGINTTDPTTKLDIRGVDAVSMSMDSSNEYRFATSFKGTIHLGHASHGSGTGINDGYIDGITFGVGIAAYAGIFVQNSGSYGSRMIFTTTNDYSYNKARMILDASGNVGINTMSPSYKLDVNGTLNATRILVNSATYGSDSLTVGGCIRITGGSGGGHAAGLRRVYFGDGTNCCLGEGTDSSDSDWMYIRGYHKILLECNSGSTTIDINGYPNSPGFIKNGYDDTYVLTAGGGAKLESNLSAGYADSAGNADYLDGIDSTGFLRWEGMKSGWSDAPFQDAVNYFNDLNNLNNGAKMLYSHYGAEYTMLFTRRSDATAHGTILKWGYPDAYIRIIRLTSGNPATSNWEKISAGYADSAGIANSVSWTNVTSGTNNKTLYLDFPSFVFRDSNGNWILGKGDNNTGTLALGSSAVAQDVELNSSGGNITLKGGGNVGIGTSSPSQKLHVAGNEYITGTILIDQRVTVETPYRRWMYETQRNAGIKYDYGGNEALIISSGSYGPSAFKVYVGNNISLNDTGEQYTTGTPALDLKYNCAAINYNWGTSTPGYNLYVNGTTQLGGEVWIGAHGSSASIGTGYAANDTTRYNYITFYGSNSNGDIQYNAGRWTSGDHVGHLFNIWDGSAFSCALSIRTINGNVGIGTSSPLQKLHVAGNEYITGYINLNDNGYLASGRSSSFTYGYGFSLGDAGKSMGLYSGANGEEGGLVVSPDTCIVYNSSDTGHNFSVYDKDLGGDLTTNTSLTFDIIGNGDYRAWSRGGFYKNGSSDSYVLLGAGGHKALDDFSMVGHTHNRLEQNLILACSLYATDSYNAYKIITKWNKSWNHMPTINIRGYAYGSAKTIDCDIVMYHYSDTPCNYSCTNKGSYPIEVYQQLENDVQVFYIRPGEYFGMFNVFVYGGMGVTSDYYTGWTMTSVDAIQGTRITQYAIATDITGSASYASNAGNADYLDGIDSTGFLRWEGMKSGWSDAPFQDAVNYFNDLNNLNNGAKMLYSHYGAEYTMLFTRRSDATAHGSILKWGYPDNYIRIIRIVGGSAQSTDWEKISAGYADSAGIANSVSWTNVTSGTNNKTLYLNFPSFVFRDANGGWILGKADNGSGELSLGSSGIAQPVCLNSSGGTVYLTGGGNVGIGTTTPAYKLHVNGNAYTDRLLASTTSTTALINTAYNNFAINFREGRSYDTGFYYGTYGNEFLALTTQQSVTSLIFGNGYDPASITSGSFITNDGSNYTYGNSTNVIQIKQNCVNIGDVWFHNVSPDYKLKVNGTSQLKGEVWIGAHGSSASIGTGYAANDTTRYNYITFYGSNSNGDIQYNAGRWTSGDHVGHLFNIWDGSAFSCALSIRTINGNVGIGTTSPGYKLDVNGIAHATRIIVNNANVGSDSLTVGGCIRITGGPTTSNMNAGLRRIFFGDGTNACLGEGGDGGDTDWMYIRGYHKILLECNSGSTTIDINGYPNSPGFKKNGSSDDYFLLGGGGHVARSAYATAHSHPYLPLSGGWMDWAAPIYFQGPNTSVYGRIQYSSTSISGLTMHGGGQSYALYIDSNGYSGAGDTGGIAIDNDGVTAFGAGDTGYVFRVLNEDNVDDGAQFWVTKAGGTYSKRGFIKEGYNDNYVLLAGGGTVAISSLTGGGTSTDTNTWRGIYVNDSSWKGNGIDTGYMNIKAGSNVSLSTSGNTLTISSSYSDTWRPVQCGGVSIGSSTLNLQAGTNVTLTRSGGDITISASGGSSTSGAYLPLAGGTMTGETIFYSSSDASAFRPDKNNYHYIGTESYRWWKAFINNVYGTFHHKDMNSDDYALCAGGGYKRIGGNDWPMIPIVPSDGVMEIGRYIDFHKVDAESNDYSVRIDCNHQTGNTIYLPTGTGKYIALTDNSDGSVSGGGGGTTVTHYTSTSAKQYVLGSGNGSQPGNNTTLSSVYSYSNFYFTSSGAYHGSDMRLKTDIHDILNEDVQKLFNTNNAFVRHFKWRENNVDSYGFIAQELQEYCPEAVDFNEDTGYYSVNYDVALSKIVGVMFKKIKEQDRIIKDLQSKLQ